MCNIAKLDRENLFGLCPTCGHAMGWHDFKSGSCLMCKDKKDMGVLSSTVKVEISDEDRVRLDKLISVLERLAEKEPLTVVNQITGKLSEPELAKEIRDRVHARKGLSL